MSTAQTSSTQSLSLIGISHATAPLDVLGKLALSGGEVSTLYQRLASHNILSDAMVLSTCNRTEIYATGPGDSNAREFVTQALREIAGDERMPQPSHLYNISGRESVAHLFNVACGLDSMILGETQILGQVKQAFEISCEHHPPSPYFERVMQAAFKAAKRARTDTEIGKGAVSIASAAVHLATRIYSDLSTRTVAIIGAGDTARLAAEHFTRYQPKRIIILNRSLERARRLAEDVRGEARGLEDLEATLAQVDVVASAVFVREPLISPSMIHAAVAARGGLPLALLDLGLPRNIASDVNEIRNALLHDLDTLKQVVDTNLDKRRREVPRVQHLINTEIDKLLTRQRSTRAAPLITALRQTIEGIRRQEVEKLRRNLSPKECEAVDKATRAVVNKLLHGPTTSIKDIVDRQSETHERLELIREIFGNLPIDGE
ncbi:MAG: glutamyl-tRNA reductase [Myxococcota bacterium]